ncbi:hypothetical protein BC628DRAFT_166803 [Trametes gibbosa]|nr:hypothetical protein BC628DRAFT_166803 [Trametes gibbosa]
MQCESSRTADRITLTLSLPPQTCRHLPHTQLVTRSIERGLPNMPCDAAPRRARAGRAHPVSFNRSLARTHRQRKCVRVLRALDVDTGSRRVDSHSVGIFSISKRLNAVDAARSRLCDHGGNSSYRFSNRTPARLALRRFLGHRADECHERGCGGGSSDAGAAS